MAETKKALFLERINRLSFQIDFLTEQRTKLTAEKTLQDNLITKFHESAYPNMILLQSLILSWFQQLNQMDQLILDNITNRMQEKIVDMDKILVNYLGILQLRSRISQTNNQIQQETQLQQFSENLDQFRQSQEKLKNTLYDELLFQYNTIIDESTEQFQDQFQEIIKLLDSFQIMMAKMHTLIPKELIFSLDESTSKIQDVEDHIENFRKPIHFGGEPVILQLVDNFDANLNQILSYVDNFSDASFDVVESMNDAYGNLKSIQETFLISLEDTTMDVLNKILPDFDAQIDNFVNYINGLLDLAQQLTFSENSDLQKEIGKIDAQLDGLLEKITQLKSEFSSYE